MSGSALPAPGTTVALTLNSNRYNQTATIAAIAADQEIDGVFR